MHKFVLAQAVGLVLLLLQAPVPSLLMMMVIMMTVVVVWVAVEATMAVEGTRTTRVISQGYVGGGSADDDDDDVGGAGCDDVVWMNPDVEPADLDDEGEDVEFSVSHCAACESSWNGDRNEYRETL